MIILHQFIIRNIVLLLLLTNFYGRRKIPYQVLPDVLIMLVSLTFIRHLLHMRMSFKYDSVNSVPLPSHGIPIFLYGTESNVCVYSIFVAYLDYLMLWWIEIGNCLFRNHPKPPAPSNRSRVSFP